MSNSRLSQKVKSSQWEPKMPFDLVVAYEDVATRDRALHLSHHLSEQLADDYDFQCSWWKFDHLANEILREQASSAATDANMIVLAMNARPNVTPLQAGWLESWLSLRSSGKAALVALIATREPDSDQDLTKTTDYLRSLAKSAKLDFFNHSFELPKAPAQPAAGRADEIPGADAPATDEKHSVFKMPVPRWGINE